jgi:hypothetical protein
MNFLSRVFATVAVALGASQGAAHGPQIQVTNDNNKITTRTLLLDGPYSTALTAPKSVYVMSVLPFNNVWYSRPNGEIDAILMQPAFPSGPGLAYGYDLADGGPQAFEAGSVISIGFTDGLKLWNGAAFVDAGATQLKAFRGSNPDISTPVESFAVTTDAGPFDSLSLPAVQDGYGDEGAEVHNSLRYALLGDGASPTSTSPDGVYLVSLQASNSQSGFNPSDEYFFVLNKNAPWSTVVSAVQSLGIAPALQQWVVPEPAAAAFVLPALMCLSLRTAAARKRGNS